MSIPSFKYHPDPLGTGSIVDSTAVCRCCGQSRGFIYVGPIYAQEELHECICPWCIADGSAHEKFGATFTDEAGIGGYGQWESVPDDVVRVIATRTPSFSGWQQERWWTHCGDAAEYLGRAGWREVLVQGEQLIDALREETGLDEGPEWDRYLKALDKEGSPTAYVFRCRHCGRIGGYSDCH